MSNECSGGEPDNIMETSATFNAKLVSSSFARIYRIYLKRDDLYFILVEGGLSANADALAVHFGLLGALIGTMVKRRAREKAEATRQRLDQENPEQLLAEHKHNFKLYIPEIREARIEPPALFAVHGKQAGRWDLFLRDGKKMKFEFETTDDMKAALNVLPERLNTALLVNVEWNEQKQRFQKKKKPVPA
jgi:hypothetical protein